MTVDRCRCRCGCPNEATEAMEIVVSHRKRWRWRTTHIPSTPICADCAEHFEALTLGAL